MLKYSRIAGTGSHLPEKVLTNAELEKMVETSDEWIRERTGIGQRHIAAQGETTVDLAVPAARRAMQHAQRCRQHAPAWCRCGSRGRGQ